MEEIRKVYGVHTSQNHSTLFRDLGQNISTSIFPKKNPSMSIQVFEINT
jgi:hypothetical protein